MNNERLPNIDDLILMTIIETQYFTIFTKKQFEIIVLSTNYYMLKNNQCLTKVLYFTIFTKKKFEIIVLKS